MRLLRLHRFNMFFFATSLSSALASASAQAAQPVTGDPIAGLTEAQKALFTEGLARFNEVDSVQGGDVEAPGKGLGPRFNLDSCAGCHAYPTVGGTSPAVNPVFAAARRYGAQNKIPAFEQANGPAREVRFKYAADGSRDGGVHDLFTIGGRFDAPGCSMKQPDFAEEALFDNLSFRIATPTFGLGLVEEILDSTILANKNAYGARKRALGILGHENRNGNTGNISRFGWKAQNQSLALFAAEAYNVEMGVTNMVFPAEHQEDNSCIFNGSPEDNVNTDGTTAAACLDDTMSFANYMRMLAPPRPATPTLQSTRGAALFDSIGCALCHTPTLMTGPSSVAALDHQAANLYSDLLVHHMGPGLADQVIQGQAGPDEFRSAPLWGVGQRLFFLHDGRASDLRSAIAAHASSRPHCHGGCDDDGVACASEANGVVGNFDHLSPQDQSAVLQFLKSL